MIVVSARKRGSAYMSAGVRAESFSNTCYDFSGDALERCNRASSAHSSTPLIFVLRAYSDVQKGTRLDAAGGTLDVRCAGRDVLVFCRWTLRSRISSFACIKYPPVNSTTSPSCLGVVKTMWARYGVA